MGVLISVTNSSHVLAYSGKKAADYADQYATSRNPNYDSFASDCTNFVSQCVYSGGIVPSDDSKEDFGVNAETTKWYHGKYTRWVGVGKAKYKWTDWKVSTTWCRVQGSSSTKGYGFHQYMKNTEAVPVYASKDINLIIENSKKGDVIQVQKAGEAKSHSVIVTKATKKDLTLAYHSNDKKDISFKDFHESYVDYEPTYYVLQFHEK